MKLMNKFTAIRHGSAILICALILTACGGGSGGGNSENAAPPAAANNNSSFVYSGPAPSSVDVQRFQQAFYNNLVNDNRCGHCHTRGGAGKTSFVDHTDINFAYSEALTLVNFENPAASKIVEKVYSDGQGHNCWETSPAACRVQMISFIEAWMANGGVSSTSVKLTAPKDRDPNGSGDGFRSFPSDSTLFAGSALYANVKVYCSRCHSDTSSVQQQPYFASSNATIAYDAIKSKIDLNDPNSNDPAKAKSRLVVRLRDEFHNCWSASCANDAAAMAGWIQQFAAQVPAVQLSATAYRSKAQVLDDGIVGVSGGRFELYQIALWRFLEGEGDTVSDTSGVSPAISLKLKGTEGDTGNYKWIGGGGVQFNGAAAYGTTSTSKKLYDLITAAGEYSVEAWVVPANVADENREIIGYDDGSGLNKSAIGGRNFVIGQTMYNYDFYNRSSATNSLGMVGNKTFSSDPDKEALQAALQHVVVTYDAVNGRKIYVDDQLVSNNFPDDKGTLASDWNSGYSVILGNTLALADKTAWKGAIRMLAVHKRALNPTQINQNFQIKPGEKRYVMFNVSKIANMPASCYNAATDTSYCYVYFEVSQYDNYAYLFNKPYFISLNSDITDLHDLEIKGIRIGINGKLSSEGQAYISVDTRIDTASKYTPGDAPGSGQLLVDENPITHITGAMGTIVPKLSGADADLLYLEFDKISSNAGQAPTEIAPPFGYVLNGVAPIDLGWRTFDEISQTYSKLTKVPITASTGFSTNPQATPPTVAAVFNTVRSQLPAIEDFPAYLASHQTAATQLAIAYCSALMWDPSLRQQIFVSNNTPAAFSSDWRNNLINPMLDQFNNTLGSAPSTSLIGDELEKLITFTGNSTRRAGICPGASCNGNNTRILNAATAACAAGLANAVITLQ